MHILAGMSFNFGEDAWIVAVIEETQCEFRRRGLKFEEKCNSFSMLVAFWHPVPDVSFTILCWPIL